jgi:hypothetical protein
VPAESAFPYAAAPLCEPSTLKNAVPATVTPSALPICCAVLSTPDADPAA